MWQKYLQDALEVTELGLLVSGDIIPIQNNFNT